MRNTNTDLLAGLRELLWTLSPMRLWEALQEAEEGVCVMVPVRVKQQRTRRR
jgi:hypothetical protein